MKQIQTESAFLLRFLLQILLTPWVLILILFGKRKLSDLFKPLRDLVLFAVEPKITTILILSNVLFFFISVFFFSEELLLQLLLYPADILGLRAFTLFTSGFLHANLLHLFGNILILFIFGRVVERELGSAKFTFVYFGSLLLSGIISASISLLTNNAIPSLGASGAIMGVVAFGILLKPLALCYEFLIPLPLFLIGWGALLADILGVFSQEQSGISHTAHLGGFFSIVLSGYFLSGIDKKKLLTGLWINICIAIATLLIIFFFL